jgi:excinuclease UvrABC nuclease subunit
MRKTPKYKAKFQHDFVMKESPHSALIDHIKKKFPVACGIYLFYNSSGCIIYVGKSVNIKNRILDHFRQGNALRFSWKGILPDNASYVDYTVTNDELLALIIEDKLIKIHRPLFNIRQKQLTKYKYLGITSGLFPGIKVCGYSVKNERRLIFGPFKNRMYIELLITLIQRYFRIRICSEVSPLAKCVYHDIGLCCGPCTGKILPFAYTAAVNSVIRFLNGDVKEIIPELKRDLKSSISGFEFEKAEKIRKMIDFCVEYSRKQFHYNLFKNKILEIYNKVTGEVKYTFCRGRIHYLAYEFDTVLKENKLVQSEYQPFTDSRILLDRSDIIYNWLKVHAGEFDYHYR